MKVLCCLLVGMGLLCTVHAQTVPSATSDPMGPLNLVWDSPSKDANGSMLLGNGDIGLNVWVEQDGDLLLTISKTDAWSGNTRLLKVGRVRVQLSPNPFAKGKPFRQELRLRQGEIQIDAGEPGAATTLRIWVDANQPVIRVEAKSAHPFALRTSTEILRQDTRTLSKGELFSACGMEEGPEPVIETADAVLPASGDRVVWYHRNEQSAWPMTMKLQGFESFMAKSTDPLMFRTFGAGMKGEGLISESPTTLKSKAPRQSCLLSIYPLTSQTPTAEGWVEQLGQQSARVDAKALENARADHRAWWDEFWNRSWIRVSAASPEVATFQRVFPANTTSSRFPLRFGADTGGGNRFVGDMALIRIYSRVLAAEDIAAQAKHQGPSCGNDGCVGDWPLDEIKDGVFPNLANPQLPGKIAGLVTLTDGPDGKCAHLDGQSWIEVPHDSSLDLRDRFTLEAWVKPSQIGGFRLIDKSQGGTSNGYMLDMYGGLRYIGRIGMISANPKWEAGQWKHVAVTFDRREGLRLYADGKMILERKPQPAQPDLTRVSQCYALQRFISACAGRGAYPIKFNGSIFTVDDYRAWGPAYWFQNTRLPYWPMLASGDWEMMSPLFEMYYQALSLAQERTRVFFGHDGAYFPETILFWGTHANNTYGWDRTGKQPSDIHGGAIARHYNGNLELLALMLDYYAYTGDAKFARERLAPMARELILFWDKHYGRDAAGRLQMTNAQALETYHGTTNPTCDVAGLQWVLDGLLALPQDLVPPELRQDWTRLRKEIPPLPLRGEPGQQMLNFAEVVPSGPLNFENPELYAVFPFRILGVGKPDLEIARRTFANRVFMGNRGWEQDDVQAAYLGLTSEARQAVTDRFLTPHTGSRFPAFYGPNYDWVPDQDHGTVAEMALQTMLLQASGDKILLFPAWPKEWDVQFKLHAPANTTVEGVYRAGRLEKLKVTPETRRKDVVEMGQQ